MPGGNRWREHRRGIVGLPGVEVGGRRERPVVHRAVAEAADRHVGDRLRGPTTRAGGVVAARRRRVRAGHADRVEQAVVHAEPPGVGDAPDDRRADLPPLAQREHRVEVRRA